MENIEIWKAVPDFEGSYEVSTHGRIRRLIAAASGAQPGLRKPQINISGYYSLMLRERGRVLSMTVHKIVMLAFIGPPPSQEQRWVNHKDGDKLNNRLDNLEYVTPSQNAAHARDVLKTVMAHGESHYSTKIATKDLDTIRELYTSGLLYREIAVKYGVTPQCIGKIVRGDTRRHG